MSRFVCVGRLVSGSILAVLLAFPGILRGQNILYNFDNVFSGTSPLGSSPWFRAELTAINSQTVRLTLDGLNLSTSEKVTELYLNLNTNYLATDLQFSFVSGTAGVTAPQPSLGLNSFKADGDGKYDILFQFAQTPSAAFTGTSHLVYDIHLAGGLVPTDFEELSMPAGGHGPFYAAIHVQGITASSVLDTSTTSGWVSPSGVTIVNVPEPASGVLLLLGGGLLAGFRTRRNRICG